MRKISILTTCYNEEDNVNDLYHAVKKQLEILANDKGYDYEHIFIDNASTDNTASVLKGIAQKDKKVKLILNAKNAGWVRSFQYGITQAYGDAVIYIEADLQTPAENIIRFVEKWEEGYEIVAGVKKSSTESKLMFAVRKLFYKLLSSFSDIDLIQNYLGVGLYDQSFIERIRKINDPYPFFRGLVAELGTNIITVKYDQLARKKGKTHFNFYQMYDLAMLGFTSYSKLPLRLASFIGYICALLSLVIAVVVFVEKLLYWDMFSVGTAAISTGLFFFASVQLIFLGLIGEYISAIFTQVRNRPLVIEKERVNFDE